ncbi:MAG: hypothetical protein V4527_09300 [Pseudomonadota bacterium]
MLALDQEVRMQELELTSARLIRLWWAITWRWVAFFLVVASVSLVLIVLAAVALMRSGYFSYSYALHFVARTDSIASLLSIPLAGVTALRFMLAGRFGSFRLGILSTAVPAEPPIISETR